MANLYNPTGLTAESKEFVVKTTGAVYATKDWRNITPTTTAQQFSQMLLEWERNGYGVGVTTGDVEFSNGKTREMMDINGLEAGLLGFYNKTNESPTLSVTLVAPSPQHLALFDEDVTTDPTTGALVRLTDSGDFNNLTDAVHVVRQGRRRYIVNVVLNASSVEPITETYTQGQSTFPLTLTGGMEFGDTQYQPFRKFFISDEGVTSLNILQEES